MSNIFPELIPVVDFVLIRTQIPHLMEFNKGYYSSGRYINELGVFQLLQIRDEGIVISKPREDVRTPILISNRALLDNVVEVIYEWEMILN